MSKRLYELLNDDNKIDEERKKAQDLRSKLGGKKSLNPFTILLDLSGIGRDDAWGKGGSGGGYGSYGKDSWKPSKSSKMEGFSSKDQKFGGFGSDSYKGGDWSSKSGSHYDDTDVKPKWKVEHEPKKEEKETSPVRK